MTDSDSGFESVMSEFVVQQNNVTKYLFMQKNNR